jgi:hypothetical protein
MGVEALGLEAFMTQFGGGGGKGGKGGMGGADIAAAGMDLVDKGVNIADKIDQMVMRHKQAKENKRQFDATFKENVRQFGLNYALQDFATRQGISMQKAQQLYAAENLAMAKSAQSENLKTSALGRAVTGTQFQWAKEDRAKQQAMGKAMQKGLVSGILGGV